MGSRPLVAQVVPVYVDDKPREWEIYRFDKLFVGSDHQYELLWKEHEQRLFGKAEVVYLSYTQETSTSKIREKLCL